MKLPTSVGVILLTDTPLFPHSHLPLHVFEQRYREMLNDALEGDCLFAVGSLTRPETGNPAACTAAIGTIGLIRASHELPDGRSELVLQGIWRVRFLHWIAESSYPRAAIEPYHFIDLPSDEAPGYQRRLRKAVSRSLQHVPPKVAAAIEAVLDQAGAPHIVADIVAQQFVAEPDVRRVLLEEPEVVKRIEILIELLDRTKPGPRPG